jgi:cytoskeletal protein CcmA (bactofilin family)
MNREKTVAQPGELNALLGRGSTFEGKLVFEGTVRIDGRFKGEIHSEGKLIVGENGDIEGEIWVESAVISGRVAGNINGKGKIELQPPARVQGNLIAPALNIQEGAVFDGYCQMSKPSRQSKPAGEPATIPEQAPQA